MPRLAPDRYTPAAMLVATPMLVALAAIGLGWLAVDREMAAYLLQSVLPRVTPPTLALAVGVPLLAGILGAASAWVTSTFEFPGRRLLSGLLILPLAIPGYLLATVYIGWLDFAGPVATAARAIGWELPAVRSTGGALMTLALALYPYVYLLTRSALLTQGARMAEVGQSLGLSPARTLRHITLPMARPWIAGGMLLVMMETLADFGTVAAFNVDTYTVAIYQTWFSLFSPGGALALSSLLVAAAIGVAWAERRQRQHQRFAGSARSAAQAHRKPLRGHWRWAAPAALSLLVGVAAIAPLLQLAWWAIEHWADFDARYAGFVWNTLRLAVCGAALLVIAVTCLSVFQRRSGSPLTSLFKQAATAGYAVPGAVLAVALLVPLAALSAWLTEVSGAAIALHTGVLTVLLAYLARFAAVAAQPIDNQWLRVSPSLEDAAQSLAVPRWTQLRQVYAPLLSSGLATAAALVAIDVIKELPMTLMTRPFGWDTLAVRVFEMTSEGQWEQAAVPGIGITLCALLPVWWLLRQEPGAAQQVPARTP